MNIGVIKEIKVKENRVGLTPVGAAQLVARGHRVQVEQGAGIGAGFSDDDYRASGADIVTTEQAWDNQLVIKVKEPLECEYAFLKRQILFTYLHLAGAPWALTEALLDGGTTAIAYETLEDADGRLPLLAPMSAIAGCMAAQMGGHYLAAHHQGKGVLLGKVLGKRHGKVLIIGDGVVGRHAAHTALGMGAEVAMTGLFAEHAPLLKNELGNDLEFFLSSPHAIAERLPHVDLLIGAVLAHGARASHVVSAEMIASMQPGSVVVDVSIDQGGCIATAHPTTHADPTYVEHGIVHYCVSNMPGAYPRTSTLALTEATLPYVLQLAEHGPAALTAQPGLRKAINTHNGHICCEPVAQAFNAMTRFKPAADCIGA